MSTSRPAPAAMLEVYEAAARDGATEVVSVHLSGEMSGTFESAQLAARQASIPVTTVDSRQVGVATGYAALAAADVLRRRRHGGRGGRDGRPATGRRRPCRCSTSTPWSTSAAAAGSVPPARCSAAPWPSSRC